MRIWIKGGKIIDPGHYDDIGDILIENGTISEIFIHSQQHTAPKEPDSEDRIIDASGKIVTPGLVDMHVHFRDPGYEYKETIHTGCLAAAHGGFTTVCCMPNTKPINDCRQVTEYILNKASESNGVRVYPVGAISKGSEGKTLCEFSELKDAGAIAVSDDGKPVEDGQLMRRALEYAKGFGLLVISHCEDMALVGSGVMNEGTVATRMGLPGIPNAAESVMVMRDIELCELTGARLHIAHVSTEQSVIAIREAKKRGIAVTAETAPHYFTLTDEAVKAYDTNAKMNPPLRSQRDRLAIIEALADGTLDAIATDHAPHSSIEKDLEFDHAANGIIGLETSLPLGLKLVEDGALSMTQLIEKMSVNPSTILGIENGIRIGSPANITIIDPELEYSIDPNQFKSLSRNTPFGSWRVKGKAVGIVIGDRLILN